MTRDDFRAATLTPWLFAFMDTDLIENKYYWCLNSDGVWRIGQYYEREIYLCGSDYPHTIDEFQEIKEVLPA